MIDLVIARAPHQILYSIERLIDSDNKSVIVLDRYNSQNYKDTITGVLKYKKWDKIIKLNYDTKGIFGIIRYFIYIFVLKLLCNFDIRINNLIIGDGDIVFGKLTFDNIKHIKNKVLIGDGADIIIRNQSKNNIQYFCHIGKKERMLLKFLRMKFEDEYIYDELFTYFQLDDPRIKTNDFPVLKNLVKQSQNNHIDYDSIYFLGTILLDRFKKEEVFSIYKKIFSRYNNLEIKYVPHRRATVEEIEIVQSTGLATIIKNDGKIIETFFLENNIIPIKLGSFFSNAVFSLSAIYHNLYIDVFHVFFDKNDIKLTLYDKRITEILYNEIYDERIRCYAIEK